MLKVICFTMFCIRAFCDGSHHSHVRLNLYDPKDILRFNGHELHFVLAPSGDHLLVVDNIESLNIWEIIENHELLGYRTMRQPEVPSPGVGEDLAPLPPFGLHMNPITYSYLN
ncbi:hypothetical protein K3T49_10200 [Paenibacillus sonchi]|nr:hypothetical protein [Paenibacillus sonchi]